MTGSEGHSEQVITGVASRLGVQDGDVGRVGDARNSR
jgi:hypothetical protein